MLVRNHLATDVMKYNAFELRDLVDPKRWYFNFGQICSFYHGGNVRLLFSSLMCKTSNLLGSMQKHVDVVEEGTEVREGFKLFKMVFFSSSPIFWQNKSTNLIQIRYFDGAN